jgi:hypothetical protein
MPLKPWYKVVTPREDLREGKPLDASEFAVHLDDVRHGSAPPNYSDPARFFAHTYLTKNLSALATETIRRLSGQRTETSAVFNLATQFGGGKTHALALLFHLAHHGPASQKWVGVSKLLAAAGVSKMPKAATAVFVGTEFDSVKGRGGSDGEPVRKTPWAEIAWQLGGQKAFDEVAEHEKTKEAPGGEVIRRFLPKDKPCLILMDELMNYVSRNRKSGLGGQLYHFLHNLSEVSRGLDNIVLAVSIPASEIEMTTEDNADFTRFKKMLDRLGKPIIMSAEAETSEIIRRRLFEWDDRAVTADGKIMLPKDALETCAEYGDWVVENRQQLPTWFPLDNARDAFAATYPFHPTLISVFERKWQELPRFQQTRGVLRLLALWVSHAYSQGFKGGHKDALIGIGSAPMDESLFRTAVFEQLGENKLEGAVTTDICGKKDSHATRLDAEADDTTRKARLHRKVATTILFESNGGQAKGEATQPEIRLAVAEPGLEIASIEPALEALAEGCFYLTVERNRYRFSLKENLNKRFADRRASIQPADVEERIREEIQKVFAAGDDVERIFFPEKSSQVPDRPVLTLVVVAPEQSMHDEKAALQFAESITREYGASGRTFKSALIFCMPESAEALREEARKVLAWEDIDNEAPELKLDDVQIRQLDENVKKAKRDQKETIWRTYKLLVLLGKDNTLKKVDLGLVHSSAAPDIATLIVTRLRQDGDVDSGISPNFLVRNWPTMKEWPTKALRDAFFASPKFPRLLSAEAVKQTIQNGVANGFFAYVGKTAAGAYKPFYFNTPLPSAEIEFSDEMFLIKGEDAKLHVEPPKLTALHISPSEASLLPGKEQSFAVQGRDQHGREMPLAKVEWTATAGKIDRQGHFQAAQQEGSVTITATVGALSATATVAVAKSPVKPTTPQSGKLVWTGEVPWQKWTNFYTKVLSKFSSGKGLKLTVKVEASPEGGVSKQKAEETKTALRELGLSEDVNVE